MIKSKMNQLANVKNQYQNADRRVLCVCSAGLLRSPTLAQYLNQKYGYNTRACGTSEEYALIPISEALVKWADEVVFVNRENYEEVKDEPIFDGKSVIVLNLPDMYERNDPDLIAHIDKQYSLAKEQV